MAAGSGGLSLCDDSCEAVSGGTSVKDVLGHGDVNSYVIRIVSRIRADLRVSIFFFAVFFAVYLIGPEALS